MKKEIIGAMLLFIVIIVNGQVKYEAQIGGSNFLGMSLNSSYDIKLSDSCKQYIIPKLGLGILAPSGYGSSCIIHYGLNYQYEKWGFGIEVSRFVNKPFSRYEKSEPFIDMLVFPNFDYVYSKKLWYLKFSVGAYFAYSKKFDYLKNDSQMEFEGDVIPGAGISYGYRF